VRKPSADAATDEAMLRSAASALASLARDSEVWPAIAATSEGGGGGAAAVWPIVQLRSSIDDASVLSHGAAAMASLAKEPTTRPQLLASGAPRALLRLCAQPFASMLQAVAGGGGGQGSELSAEQAAVAGLPGAGAATLLTRACSALASLALDADGRAALEREGAGAALVQLLRRLSFVEQLRVSKAEAEKASASAGGQYQS
jgi:hypothetical protein